MLFTDEVNGAGDLMTDDIADLVKSWYPNQVFKNCLEWCSGPGFLGFSILSHGLCNTLHLSDIYPLAGAVVKQTIALNGLEHKVNFHLSDNFKSFDNDLTFELSIANPPHFACDPYAPVLTDPRRYKDTDWNTHRNFFNNVKQHLSPDGKIILMENIWGSGLTTFEQMISHNDLKINRHQLSDKFKWDIWYLEVTHK